MNKILGSFFKSKFNLQGWGGGGGGSVYTDLKPQSSEVCSKKW